jgi:hypothetical protein
MPSPFGSMPTIWTIDSESQGRWKPNSYMGAIDEAVEQAQGATLIPRRAQCRAYSTRQFEPKTPRGT